MATFLPIISLEPPGASGIIIFTFLLLNVEATALVVINNEINNA
jgi:hypothetical protein